MSSKKTAQYVMLAKASYVDVTNPDGIPFATNSDAYKKALENSNFAKKR